MIQPCRMKNTLTHTWIRRLLRRSDRNLFDTPHGHQLSSAAACFCHTPKSNAACVELSVAAGWLTGWPLRSLYYVIPVTQYACVRESWWQRSAVRVCIVSGAPACRCRDGCVLLCIMFRLARRYDQVSFGKLKQPVCSRPMDGGILGHDVRATTNYGVRSEYLCVSFLVGDGKKRRCHVGMINERRLS